ncbi:betaine homocysteine S-methyltransferase 1 [Apostichopus japonicus]|uniref:Betaine homocysteine S-methyltransferase 1 n=1 Tax=Stichopus japonicus TaxID=307972 RepID=A0A2G8LLW8_STIJA|nr:betaine homocysteine S-methyltransferase 1 [Apostichopus japonicus]
MEKLNNGEKIVVAEGYIFQFERRCYLKAGPFVPVVVLERPDLVKQLHHEFVRAGSDVVQAFTYYSHREKMKLINREGDLEKMNRMALKIAREVADETGTLMAGDICSTNLYDPKDPKKNEAVKQCFVEQVQWAVEEGADFIVAETLSCLGEALIALEVIKEYGNGVPAVITLVVHGREHDEVNAYTLDDVEITEAMKRLEAAGADVVGLNCARGPETIIPLMEKIKKSGVKVPLAALPVTYRTTKAEPTFMRLTDPRTGKKLFPTDLDCAMSSRSDIVEFGRRCDEIGIPYLGLCCGNSPHYTRALCESIGRRPPASKYSPDMSLHCIFGTDDKLNTFLTKNAVDRIVS